MASAFIVEARLPVGLVPLVARALGLGYLEAERLDGLPEVVLGVEVVGVGVNSSRGNEPSVPKGYVPIGRRPLFTLRALRKDGSR